MKETHDEWLDDNPADALSQNDPNSASLLEGSRDEFAKQDKAERKRMKKEKKKRDKKEKKAKKRAENLTEV